MTDPLQLPSLPTDEDTRALEDVTGLALGLAIKELTKMVDAKLAGATEAALGKAAVGAALYVAAEIFARLLDTMVDETLNEVGDAHFRTARNAFQDAQQEPSPEGQIRQFTVAETALQTAHEFYRTVADRQAGRTLDPVSMKRTQIVACGKAAEAALCVSTINQQLATDTTAATWADRAKAQFDRYVDLSHQAARNGIWMNRVGEIGARVGQGVAPVAGLGGSALLFVRGRPRAAYCAVRGIPTSVRGLGEAADAASIRRARHRDRPDRLAQEQQAFEELYAKLTPDADRP